VQQEVVLAMLAKEPSQGKQLRARLDRALGPLGEAMNDGQIYVTHRRLEKAGLVVVKGIKMEVVLALYSCNSKPFSRLALISHCP
jgi:hypothetical protein